jgi:hypothetical protein
MRIRPPAHSTPTVTALWEFVHAFDANTHACAYTPFSATALLRRQPVKEH